MKIDTSNIKLSSAHDLLKKNTTEIKESIKFTDMLDQRVVGLKAQGSGQWNESVGLNEPLAVSLLQQFRRELEKLRQILDAVCDRLNASCIKDGQIQLVAIDHTSIDPGGIMKEYAYFKSTTYSYQEKETTDFFADGAVKTKDGRTLEFSFQMNLAREFIHTEQFAYSEKGYVLIDPLVIHLNGSLPQISEASVSFDLNCDGMQDDLLVPQTGTGFLCLDKNKDGIINDGSELFGPSTGDGFGELGGYDLDHNLWLDENDAIFDELTLWEKDEKGAMQLRKIKDAGIGAIYLVGIETPFDLKDGKNNLQARIKKSGFALNENGSAIAVQEMDWTV